jgi:L-asparaginase
MTRVRVVTTGGTITMTAAGAEGVHPTLTADDLTAAVPQVAEVAKVEAETFSTVPGAHLTIDDVLRLMRENVAAALDDGVDGIVVVQGTDTLEETAFVADLVHAGQAPIVFTGAMRSPQTPGADGPANLLASVRAAASPQARGAGVLVSMNGELHAARFVRKTHAFSPAAFASPSTGPVGWVIEDRVRVLAPPVRVPGFAIDELGTDDPAVALHRVTLGDDGRALPSLPDLGFQGLVVEAFGVGHAPQRLVAPLAALTRRIPVVLASRTGAGEGMTHTYGFPGSESDLLSRGLLCAGLLDGLKARILLSLALRRRGTSPSATAAVFEAWS